MLSLSILSAILPTVAGAAIPPMPDPATDRDAFLAWQDSTRNELLDMLGVPDERVPLAAEPRGEFVHEDMVIEKWIFTSEPGSRIPAILYRPIAPAEKKLPAVVLTYGHGGSKSQPDYQYPAQVFVKLGFVCLAIDPVGEEERNITGRMGTRAHDRNEVPERADAAGRLVMGKLVLDAMRGVDFLLDRNDVDPERIGVSGNSLGGAVASWMAILDTRLRFAVVSGWYWSPGYPRGKHCTLTPNVRMEENGLVWDQGLGLAAPHCAVRIVNGDADVIIDKDGTGTVWKDTDAAVATASKIYAALGKPDGLQSWYEPGGGHRPYVARKPNVEWLVKELKPAGFTPEQAADLKEINFGEWCDRYEMPLEKLYGTDLHLRGAIVVDMDIVPLKREELAVLTLEEIGRPEYTVEGWLDLIENKKWMQPQDWIRDVDKPCIALGAEGEFDSQHVHAPFVYVEDGQYKMLYTGAEGSVTGRRMKLGLATSKDGRTFTKYTDNPILALDGQQVTTPTLLRNPDGSVLRENGRFRMWLTSTGKGEDRERVFLMESSSEDGLNWAEPKELNLEFAFAPTIFKEGDTYKLWYTESREDPWPFRYATSKDGSNWELYPDPVMVVDQDWEKKRLFYPTVLKHGDKYLMWYGSYWNVPNSPMRTSLGFAVSDDGIHWIKNPHNPVFGPDPTREWESHYTTCQSILPLPGGGWRIWYASRTKPPYTHKYFAIGTAKWDGPEHNRD